MVDGIHLFQAAAVEMWWFLIDRKFALRDQQVCHQMSPAPEEFFNCYKIPVAVARHICSHLGSFQCQCQGIVSRLAMPDALVETKWSSMTLTSMCFLIGWYFCIIDLYLSYSCIFADKCNTSGINKVHHSPIHSKQGKIVQTVSAKLEDVKPKTCDSTRWWWTDAIPTGKKPMA